MPLSDINPIPDCQMTWVFGLLETLEDRGGRDDGYKIARDLQFKFSDLLKVGDHDAQNATGLQDAEALSEKWVRALARQMLEQVVFAERDTLHRGGVRAADEFTEAVEPEPAHGEYPIAVCGSGIADSD